MILHKRLACVASLAFFLINSAHADDALDAMRDKVENTLGVPVSKVGVSAIPNLYEVTSNGRIFYVDAEVKHLVQGEMFDLERRVNLTEAVLKDVRLTSLIPFAEDIIEYKAQDEKYVVTVFTDTDCGYCRKLHGEINEYQEPDPKTGKMLTKPGYNDLGITIRYLAYPRAGGNSPTYYEMQSIWCADDKATAMSAAKNGDTVPQKACDNTIMQQYALGQQLGVRGTPAMVLSDGSMLPGYRNPEALLQHLKSLR